MIATEVVDQSRLRRDLPTGSAYNDAHELILDDGADIDYTSATFEDIDGSRG